MRYRVVLFDFDGTLADSLSFFSAALNDLAEPMGFRRLSAEELEETRSLGPRDVMRRIGISPWKVPALALRMRRRMNAEAHRIRPFPGVAAMLARLADGGVELGVVTSNSEANVRAILGASADRVRHWKCEASLFGKAALFRALLRDARLDARDVLTVGDEVRDADAARRVRIDFGAATWGYATRAALEATAPALLFERIDEIPDRLLPSVR